MPGATSLEIFLSPKFIPIVGLLGLSIMLAVCGYVSFCYKPSDPLLDKKGHPDQQTKPQSSMGLGILYWLSLGTSTCWYILPLLEQPRFPSLFYRDSLTGVISGAFGMALFLIAGGLAMWVFNYNMRATGPAMKRFRQPASLLSSGPYRWFRHPMFTFDFLAHLGLCLATGALYITALLPLYFVLSYSFNFFEERYVLRKQFPEQYKSYSHSVPGFWNRYTILIILISLSSIVLNLMPLAVAAPY